MKLIRASKVRYNANNTMVFAAYRRDCDGSIEFIEFGIYEVDIAHEVKSLVPEYNIINISPTLEFEMTTIPAGESYSYPEYWSDGYLIFKLSEEELIEHVLLETI